MNIKNIIVHEVDKSKSTTSGDVIVKVNPRSEENPINEHSESLVGQLSKLFRNTGLSSGNFKAPIDKNDDITDFEKLLTKNFNNGQFPEFISFTQAAARDFAKLLNKAGNAKGGYLWFNHYEYDGKNFLSVVLLRRKAALRIKNLSLDPIEEIDLDKLHMAARINLTDWSEKSPLKTRYISFRVGRSTENVTDYFSDFIGCQEYTVAKEDTANLIEITVAYCKHHKFNKTETEAAKTEVFEKCKKWIEDDKPVLLSNLSTLLDSVFSKEDDKSGEFLAIAQDEPYCLNSEIKIDKSVLGNLIRYRGNNSKMNISFDSTLLGETVIFDEKKGYLEFREIPEKLMVQLKKGKPD